MNLGGSPLRIVLIGALLVFNVGLVALNLFKHDVGPFDSTRGDRILRAVGLDSTEEGDGSAAVSTSGDASQQTDQETTTESSTDNASSDEEVWPTGTDAIPSGPPIARSGLLYSNGRLELSGSAPNWSLVTDIMQVSAERLPGGIEAVDIEYSWHPEASSAFDIGPVIFERAVVYDSSGVEIPDGDTSNLEMIVSMAGKNPEMEIVVRGYGDGNNVELGRLRAELVQQTLIEAGCDPAKLSIRVYGGGPEGSDLPRQRTSIEISNFLVGAVSP